MCVVGGDSKCGGGVAASNRVGEGAFGRVVVGLAGDFGRNVRRSGSIVLRKTEGASGEGHLAVLLGVELCVGGLLLEHAPNDHERLG